jgi:pyruvate dehydrogenase E1 component
VVLAQTKKGYGMGDAGQGRMSTHQQKKLERADLLAFRDRFKLPLSDEQAATLGFYRPPEDSAEMRYLHVLREALGGYVPRRVTRAARCCAVFCPAAFAVQAEGKEKHDDTFVRMLTTLLKDPALGRASPIVADEYALGMANLTDRHLPSAGSAMSPRTSARR